MQSLQNPKGANLNGDRVEGNRGQLKGKVKASGCLIDGHLDVIAGKRDQLAGQIQETYGIGKYEAEIQIRNWES